VEQISHKILSHRRDSVKMDFLVFSGENPKKIPFGGPKRIFLVTF
jgi:hypothetical protein